MHEGVEESALDLCCFSLAQLWTRGLGWYWGGLGAQGGEAEISVPRLPSGGRRGESVSGPSGALAWRVVASSGDSLSRGHLETPCSGHCLVPPEVPAEAAPRRTPAAGARRLPPLQQPHTLQSRSSRLLPFPEEEALKLKQLLIYKPIFP